ncbi:MAG: class I SAM-dependent methyltransferase [Endozoicomonas sp.]
MLLEWVLALNRATVTVLSGGFPVAFKDFPAVTFTLILALSPLHETSAREQKQQEYSLPNSWSHAEERAHRLEQNQNPETFRFLEKIHIQPGWHCLDVGAGAGSVALWLADKAGPEGKVTATDIDTRLLRGKKLPNLVVLKHDILSDPLTDQYDLIHMRDVLMHLQDKSQVVKKLASALKPGGILVVDDLTVLNDAEARFSSLDAPRDAWEKEARDYEQLTRSGVISFRSGWFNHELMRKAGLVDVQAEMTSRLTQGGDTPEGRLLYLSTLQLAPHQNRTSEENRLYQEILAGYQSPDSYWWDHIKVITWGRKPLKP